MSQAVRFPTRQGIINETSLVEGHGNLPLVLQQMGYTSLREGQEDVILNLMGQRDTICILPTGTGKTACFVIPTLCLEWHTIVFSPLVALMRDQVQSLQRQGIRAAQMSSTQTDAENAMAARAWMAGDLHLFYVAPERLGNQLFKEAINAVPPDMVVLDEAHTLSSWSDNFRPAYCSVGDFIAQKDPKVVAAFTATAPPEVEADVRRVLGLNKATKLIHYPRRKNLELTTEDFKGVQEIANRVDSVKGTVLIYCATIKKVEELATQLSDMLPGTEVTMYHGELNPAAKRTNQDLFMSNRAKVMVATNAFGMGIDKPDIRAVIHRDFPGSIEALAQETGRAGRDGQHSLCLTYYDPASLHTQEFFIQCAFPSKRDVQAVYNVLMEKIDKETQTCKLTADEIGKFAGLRGHSIGAVFSILIGSNVVERVKSDVQIARIKTLVDSDDVRFKDWREVWERGGDLDKDGFYEVDLNWLVSNTGLGKPTVTKYLRSWDKSEIISYIAPFRGSPTRVIGDLNLIDFERLKIKENKAWEKLADVQKYFQVPQSEKHSFIEKYFGVESC